MDHISINGWTNIQLTNTHEFKISELTTEEFANRLLDDFLIQNKSEDSFNEKQRIILAFKMWIVLS